MPDKRKKLTLCAIPKDVTSKPRTSGEIMDGQFYMINGQQSVEASKLMRTKRDINKKISKELETWECFIVWNEDKSILRKISAYYNRVNHFQNYKPTWATNIIGARAVWKSLNCPTPPKKATEV